MPHSRRFVLLTPADLAALAEGHDCEAVAHLDADAPWARSAMTQFGFCGVQLQHEGEPVAHLVVCPSVSIPAGHPLSAGARAPRGAGLLSLWVHPDWAPDGLGRQVVQHAAARLHSRATCIEAVGALVGSSCAAPNREWLVRLGFTPTGAVRLQGERMRLELEHTVPWRENLRHTLARVNTWLSQPNAEPSNRA